MVSFRKANIYLIASLLCSIVCDAQSSIHCNGADITSFSGSVSYTIGQIDYTFMESTTGKAGLGVQQPAEIFKAGKSIALNCLVFPNPAPTELHLLSVDPDYQLFNYSLYDMQGRLWMRQSGVDINSSIRLDNLASGTYVIYISNASKDELTCKFIKINP